MYLRSKKTATFIHPYLKAGYGVISPQIPLISVRKRRCLSGPPGWDWVTTEMSENRSNGLLMPDSVWEVAQSAS